MSKQMIKETCGIDLKLSGFTGFQIGKMYAIQCMCHQLAIQQCISGSHISMSMYPVSCVKAVKDTAFYHGGKG